jgi:hypothetical protein
MFKLHFILWRPMGLTGWATGSATNEDITSGSPIWCVVSCPRLATVARGVFPCPRLATNASADSRLRLQLCRLCRLASAQLIVFPQLTLQLLPWLYNLGSDHIEKAALTLLSGLAITK